MTANRLSSKEMDLKRSVLVLCVLLLLEPLASEGFLNFNKVSAGLRRKLALLVLKNRRLSRIRLCRLGGCPKDFACVTQQSYRQVIEQLCDNRSPCLCVRGCRFKSHFIPKGETSNIDSCRMCTCLGNGKVNCVVSALCKGRFPVGFGENIKKPLLGGVTSVKDLNNISG